jgi:glycosyltransferase involved in cell wall biosynthesis
MRLLYIANIRLPTEKAHGIQIMYMCEAFARAGVEVELVVPQGPAAPADPFQYYGVERLFTITRLPSVIRPGWGRIGFWIRAMSFARAAARYLRQSAFDYVYSRDKLVLLSLPRTTPCIWEVHGPEARPLMRILGERARMVVAITHSLAALCHANGIAKEKIVVAPDGVDLAQFSVALSRQEARQKLALPLEKKIIVYTGHLYIHKGAYTLATAASQMRDSADILIVFVGGTDVDLAHFRKAHEVDTHIRIVGQRPHSEIPYYLRSADVLVLPNSSTSDTSRLYTSPMKLFEYMASGTPIVASDIEAVREVVDESMVSFFTPDDSTDLARCVKEVLANYSEAQRKADTTLSVVGKYSWNTRAQAILSRIQEL